MCSLVVVAWYSPHRSTAADCTCCMFWTMLPSFTWDRPMKTESTTTVMATRLFSRLSLASAPISMSMRFSYGIGGAGARWASSCRASGDRQHAAHDEADQVRLAARAGLRIDLLRVVAGGLQRQPELGGGLGDGHAAAQGQRQ